MNEQPFVSIVTPFFNTADYLEECIEGVLGQTYKNFEYLLVNNRSTDESRAIAARHAARDSRIRLIDNVEFLGQLENFNQALQQISPHAKYVKMALGDDLLFPECVERMVEVAEQSPTIGIVSSYRFWGEHYVSGVGVSFRDSHIPGLVARRQMLLDKRYLTGSQNTVLYRADVVRARRPFFEPGRYFADTDTAHEILRNYDLGFVHQILSFSRTDNDSVLTRALAHDPNALYHFLSVECYGKDVVSGEALTAARRCARREYLQSLGRRALYRPGRAFWDYHRIGLAAVGEKLDWIDVLPWTATEGLRLLLHPRSTMSRLAARRRRRGAIR